MDKTNKSEKAVRFYWEIDDDEDVKDLGESPMSDRQPHAIRHLMRAKGSEDS